MSFVVVLSIEHKSAVLILFLDGERIIQTNVMTVMTVGSKSIYQTDMKRSEGSESYVVCRLRDQWSLPLSITTVPANIRTFGTRVLDVPEIPVRRWVQGLMEKRHAFPRTVFSRRSKFIRAKNNSTHHYWSLVYSSALHTQAMANERKRRANIRQAEVLSVDKTRTFN